MVLQHMDQLLVFDHVAFDHVILGLVVFDHVTFDADKVGVNTLDDFDIIAVLIQVQMIGWLFVSHMKLESRDC